MKFLAALALLLSSLHAADPENFRYSINWQSGLSLGEASLSITPPPAGTPDPFKFEWNAEASIPGYSLSYSGDSTSDSSFCSTSFHRLTRRGKNTGEETTEFREGKAIRKTKGGGETTYEATNCPRDAMAFLQYVRQELRAGRVPQPARIFFGAPYDVTLQFKAVERIRVADKTWDAEKIQVSIKGSKADYTVDVFFARDAARTPLLARIPLDLGVFSVELVP